MLNPNKLKEAIIEIKKISSRHLILCKNKTPTDFFTNTIIKFLNLNIKEDIKS